MLHRATGKVSLREGVLSSGCLCHAGGNWCYSPRRGNCVFQCLGKKANVLGTQSKKEDVTIEAARATGGKTKPGLAGLFKGLS